MIKSKILQNNLYNLCLHRIIKGNIVSISIDEDYQGFNRMLLQIEHDLFISGITCNSIGLR